MGVCFRPIAVVAIPHPVLLQNLSMLLFWPEARRQNLTWRGLVHHLILQPWVPIPFEVGYVHVGQTLHCYLKYCMWICHAMPLASGPNKLINHISANRYPCRFMCQKCASTGRTNHACLNVPDTPFCRLERVMLRGQKVNMVSSEELGEP